MAEWCRTGLDDARIQQPNALRRKPSASNHALRLEANLSLPRLASRSQRIDDCCSVLSDVLL
jgi:hypothetical protein